MTSRPSGLARDRARELRQRMTPAEETLWEQLRYRRMLGLHFRRQAPIEGYIADFYCAKLRLVIELDGPIHDDERQYRRDGIRERLWAEAGYTILRFNNDEVTRSMGDVLARIHGAIMARREALPRPPR